MIIKKTYNECIVFNAVAAEFLKQNEGAENKLVLSVKAILKQLTKVFDDYNEASENIRLDNCLTDPTNKKILRTADNNYEYTVEGLKNLNKQLKELGLTEVELKSKFVAENDTFELKPYMKKAFADFVLSPVLEEEEA
jgi:hypothetical protein